jgi:lipid-A-disaccharide synthase
MTEESGEIENWLEDAAVLGLWEVLKKYSYFREKMEETSDGVFLSENPDGVVLIDYPGFNLRLAERLREDGYEGQVDLLHQSPGMGVEKGEDSQNGGAARPDDLYFSF